VSLELDLRVAARGLEVALRVDAGETVALLGANGAGKSSVLGVVAGLVGADRARVVLDGRVLDDTAAGTCLPPHRRGVALLDQQPALFPHLDARGNVAFAPRSAGLSRRAALDRADELLARVDAGGLGDRSPRQLSGGQAQRVALARALAADPPLLLLDEPMAALDRAVVPALRRTLRSVLADRTTLLVTHDPVDALALADRVVVLEGGRVVEQGAPAAVLDRPQTAFTAELSGRVLVTGTLEPAGLRLASGALLPARGAHDRSADGGALPTGATARAAIDPARVEVVAVGAGRADAVDDVVASVDLHGATVRIRGALLAADVPVAVAAALAPVPGDAVAFRVPADAVEPY
jgi:molybdate transport system ATP-binding protein